MEEMDMEDEKRQEVDILPVQLLPQTGDQR
jgi:hypothetical protein